MSDWDDDEAEREMERARRDDSRRTRGVVRATQVPRVPELGGTGSKCMACGAESERLALDPIQGGRVVCTGRYGVGSDGKHARVDCYDKLDREIADRNGVAYRRTVALIRAAKERKSLTAEDKRYLEQEYGAHSANVTIQALEERFRRQDDERKSGGGGRRRGLENV